MNKFALGCGVLIAILLVVVVVAAITIGGSYNRLVRLQQAVDQSWAQVQNVYQRRADLIPNLVNTVSGAANFEKSTLVEVTNARASVGRVQMQLDPNKAPADAAQLQQFQAAQGQLSAALSRLLLVSERYPDLKANQNFLSLQAQLEGTENRISVERGNFNQTVQDYNVAVRSFPTNLIAGMLGFPPKPFFTAQPGAEKPPPVQFNFSSPAPRRPRPPRSGTRMVAHQQGTANSGERTPLACWFRRSAETISFRRERWMNKGSREKFAIAQRNRQHATSVRSPAITLALSVLFAISANAAEVIPPTPKRVLQRLRRRCFKRSRISLQRAACSIRARNFRPGGGRGFS